MRAVDWSGCLHGCAGALDGVEDRRLNQVIEKKDPHGIYKHSTCEAYCTGVVGQPSVVEAMKWAEKDPSDGELERETWVGACLEGCEGGYARRPGCRLSETDGTEIECE